MWKKPLYICEESQITLGESQPFVNKILSRNIVTNQNILLPIFSALLQKKDNKKEKDNQSIAIDLWDSKEWLQFIFFDKTSTICVPLC